MLSRMILPWCDLMHLGNASSWPPAGQSQARAKSMISSQAKPNQRHQATRSFAKQRMSTLGFEKRPMGIPEAVPSGEGCRKVSAHSCAISIDKSRGVDQSMFVSRRLGNVDRVSRNSLQSMLMAVVPLAGGMSGIKTVDQPFVKQPLTKYSGSRRHLTVKWQRHRSDVESIIFSTEFSN